MQATPATPGSNEPTLPSATPPAATTPGTTPSVTPPAADTKPLDLSAPLLGAVSGQGAAPIPSTPAATEEKKEIYLNFENADLSSFIDYIAEIKKLNIFAEKQIEGAKISLTIRDPLTVEGAWNIFQTVLDTSGYAIVKTGDIHKIVSKDKKLTQPLPAYINVAPEKLPDNDSTIRYVFLLSNLQIGGDVTNLLQNMLSTPNALVEQKDMNAFIITDKAYNVKAAARLLLDLDSMGLPETVTVLKLRNVNATDVVALLTSLIRKPDVNPLARLLGKVAEGSTEYFPPTTRFFPEERTNSLVLLGTTKGVDKIVNFITKNIDTEIKAAESPLHIYEFQYIDATAAMAILKDVTAAPDSTAGQSASKFGAIRGGVKYFRPMTFQVDKGGNRLLVSCVDQQDWKLLKKTLDDMDKPQPQVALETLIVMIDPQDYRAFGGATRNKKTGQLGKGIDFQSAALDTPSVTIPSGQQNANSLLGNMLNQITANVGQSVLSFGNTANAWAVLQAIKTFTCTTVLSQPFVTVANKTTANLIVGNTQRIIDSTQNTGTGGATLQGFKDAVANTTLNITPQINIDGVIVLDVNLEITDFVGQDPNHTISRKVKTNVTIADGQVLVLGGFVKTTVGETEYKTPILANIPLLGWFFRDKERTTTKSYLFIFITPTIIKPRSSPGMQLYTKMKLHQATDDIEDTVETKHLMDPIHNWFFNPEKENYSHKVIDFANARYQPTTVDIRNDPYYRANKEEELGKPPAATSFAFNTPPAGSAEPPQAAAVTEGPGTQPETPLLTPQTPLATTVQPQGTPTTVAPEKQTASDDQEIEGRRKKLKDLLTPTANIDSMTTVPEVTLTKPTPNAGAVSAPTDRAVPQTTPLGETQKRDDFKKLFAKQQTSPPQELEPVNPRQRNVLKEFLAANPSLAKAKDHGLEGQGQRKAEA
jgi:general secretion pathway protein D